MNQQHQGAFALAAAIPATISNTMTSREISDLVESRHDKVKQSIERLAKRGTINPPPVGEYLDSLGRPAQEYRIGKRDSYIIVAQLSPEFTARLVDRWQELEGAAPIVSPANVPQSFADALRLAADQQDTIAAQVLLIAAAAPAVAFVDRYVDSTGLKGFRQVCKLLGAKENAFRDFLIDEKIMYKLAGEWTPHAQHLDTGRFEVKAGTSDVSGHAFNSARWTPKGVSWIAGEWAKFRLGALNG